MILASALSGLPLLAAGWEQLVVGAVALGIWLINQYIAARNKAKPPMPRPQPGAPAAGRPGQKGLLDEVEQFLKEARKQMEPKDRPAAQQRDPSKLTPRQARQLQAKQQQARKPKTPPPPPVQRGMPSQRPRDSVDHGRDPAQSMRTNVNTGGIDTSRFDQRAEQLSHLKQTVDQDIGAHVQSVFDHQIGRIAADTTTSIGLTNERTEPSPAEHLITMLRDPQGLRNAVLLQEILRPPADRW